VAAAVAAGQVPSALRLFVDWTKEAAGVFDELPTQAQQVLLDNAHTLRRHMSAQPATVTFEQVQTLNMPMTLLCGEESRRYFRLLVEALHDCLPRSTVVELPAANHLAPVEQSELFTQHVLAHLAHHIGAAA
jgi:pimeloyl-ACP methyl ester carboxylesterase